MNAFVVCASMDVYMHRFMHECICVCIAVHIINTNSLKAKSLLPKYFSKVFLYQFFSSYFSGYISFFYIHLIFELQILELYSRFFKHFSLIFLQRFSQNTKERCVENKHFYFFATNCCYINTN